ETSTLGKPFCFISESKGSSLTVVTTERQAQVEITYKAKKGGEKETALYDFDMLIDVKGWRAIGNKMPQANIMKVKVLANKASEDLEKKIKEGTEAGKDLFDVGSTIDLELGAKGDQESKDSEENDQLGLF